jgi:hypothetical protein
MLLILIDSDDRQHRRTITHYGTKSMLRGNMSDARSWRVMFLVVESGVAYCLSAVRSNVKHSENLVAQQSQLLVPVLSFIRIVPQATLGDLYSPIHVQVAVRSLSWFGSPSRSHRFQGIYPTLVLILVNSEYTMYETFFSTDGRFDRTGGEPGREGRLETLKFRTRTTQQSVTSDFHLDDTGESISSQNYREDRHKPSVIESPIYEGQERPSRGEDEGIVTVDNLSGSGRVVAMDPAGHW